MITAHLNYLGFYHAHRTDTIPLKDKHVYKIPRIEGHYQIPIGWTTGSVHARVGDCITEAQVEWALVKNISVEVE